MKRIIVFLIVFCALFSFMSWAQTTQPPPIPVDYTFPLDNNGAVMNLAGGWTAQDLAASQLPTLAPLIWGALNKISLPVWQTWTVIKDPPFLNSWSCASSLEVNGTIVATNGFTNWTPTTNDLTSIAHEMSLAMFTPCSLMMADGYDYDYSLVEGQARAKAFVALTILANSNTPGFTPETGLGFLQAKLEQDFFAAGGGFSFLIGTGADRDAVGALFELFASKLGGTFVPTFVPIDQLWGGRPVPATVSKQNTAVFVSDIDRAVGQIAGKAPSTLLSNLPELFSLSQSDRTALGWTAQNDPTNGLWLEAFADGGWEGTQTIVNPIGAAFLLRERQNGATIVPTDTHMTNLTVTGPDGTLVYNANISNPPGSGGLSAVIYSPSQTATPPQGVSRLTKDGLYTTSACIADTGSCGQQVVQSEFLVDVSGWTNKALVVMSPGAKLYLAPGQPYTLTYIGDNTDVVAIGNLPSVYAEVALTDGTVTRLFPWMPTAPNSNIWNWAPFDNPKLLVPLNAVTWDPLITPKNQVSRGGWITLDTLGANHGDPDFTKLVNGDFPVTAGVNAWGSTRAVFSLNGQTWNCAMNYVGANQVNVQVCPDLPVGQTVNVQVSVNGVLSNSWPLQVVADTPDIFMVNSGGYTVPAVTFATGPKLGQVVTPANPAPKGQALSLYYTGCGTLSEAQQAGVPAPLDHLVYATDPSTLLVGTAQAQILFNGLAPGYVGLCQMNFVVPGLPAFTTGGSVSSSPLGLTIGGNPANKVVLSVQ